MNWFFLTIISITAVAIASILQRALMKDNKSDPYTYALTFHFLLGILNVIVAILFGSQFSLLSGNPILLILSAVLWGATSILMFKALQLLEASEVTILSRLSVVVTIVASIIFLHESFNFQKMLGSIIILTSTALVANMKKGMTLNKGVVYTLGMAVCSGIAMVVDAWSLHFYDPVAYNTITNFLIGFLLLILYPKSLHKWKELTQPNFLKIMIPLGVLSTFQAITNLYALSEGGNTAQIGTIRQSSSILTVVLAIVFLKERDHMGRKILAAVMVTVGVMLLK